MHEENRMNHFKVSAIVVTYNRIDLLRTVLDSLQNQTYSIEKVYVIDNASTDGTDQIIQSNYPNISYMRLDKNYGGSYGFYIGVKESLNDVSELVWILDDDAVPKQDALELLIKSAPISFADCVALSNTVIDYESNIISMHRRNINLKTLKGDAIPDVCYREPFFKVGLVTFVGLLVFKSAVKKVGLPRDDYFFQFDDSEYSLRLGRIGNIYNISNSVIIHPNDKKSHAQKDNLTVKEYYNQRNRIHTYMLYSKHKIIFFSKLVKEAILNISGIILFRRQKWLRLKIYLLSLYHGLSGKLGYNSKIHRMLEKCPK